MRNVLRKIVESQEYRFPSTIEDPDVLPQIQKTIKEYGRGMGEEKKLIYRTDVDHLNIDALIEIQENEDIQDTVTKKLKE